MKKSALLMFVLIFVGGCAAPSGFVQIDPDTYMVSRQSATGCSGLGTLKADAFQEANQYCIRQNKSIRILNTTESSPPYAWGKLPRAEIQFMCLEKTDVEPMRPQI